MNSSETIESVRSFNRFYTKKIGLLNQRLPGSGFSLPEARILFELSQRPTTASQLIELLSMDRGYVSRVLNGLQRRGLIRREDQSADKRTKLIALSSKGKIKFKSLEAATRSSVETLLYEAKTGSAPDIVRAMKIIQDCFHLPSAGQIELRDLRVGDIGWITHRQGLLYAREFGWDASYEALVAKILSEFSAKFDSSCERSWVACRDGHVLGSVFLVRESDDTARLRLLYVESCIRGAGLGHKLVHQCTEFAKNAGFERIVLWTQSNLVAARAIYAKEGYRLIKSEPHHSFGVDLIGETWELTL